jgi:hypothetical protein
VWPACLFGRPFAFREGLLIWPWTFFLFTWSAAAYGPCFTLLITWITEKVTRKKLVKDNVIDLLAKISGWMIFTYTIAKIMRHNPLGQYHGTGLGQTWPISTPATPFTAIGSFLSRLSSAVSLPAIILISRR